MFQSNSTNNFYSKNEAHIQPMWQCCFKVQNGNRGVGFVNLCLLRSATMLNAVARASSGVLRSVQPAANLSQLQNGTAKVLPVLTSNRK
jgi:hypothetical protein